MTRMTMHGKGGFADTVRRAAQEAEYGPDHIYTRIASVHGSNVEDIAVACEIAKEHGICIQTYADPVHAAAMLAQMDYIAKAQKRIDAR